MSGQPPQAKASEVDLANITNFVEILEAVHLYGYSSLNPNRMSNNCVSVTLAKILGYADVHELWDQLLGAQLLDQPLGEADMQWLLNKTGLRFVFRVIHDSSWGSGPFQNNKHFIANMVHWKVKRNKTKPTPVTVAPAIELDKSTSVSKSKTNSFGLILPMALGVAVAPVDVGASSEQIVSDDLAILCGVAYMRPDQTGHCIVGSFIGEQSKGKGVEMSLTNVAWHATKTKSLSWSFLCYQHSNDGIALEHELESAKRVLFFSFVRDDATEQYFQQLCDSLLTSTKTSGWAKIVEKVRNVARK
jgi:hypothetical protein